MYVGKYLGISQIIYEYLPTEIKLYVGMVSYFMPLQALIYKYNNLCSPFVISIFRERPQ